MIQLLISAAAAVSGFNFEQSSVGPRGSSVLILGIENLRGSLCNFEVSVLLLILL
jgi:hypothetical protein